MDIKELAKRVIATTDLPDRAKTCNYYMLNISHPVIAELKNRFCKENNINPNFPMADWERTEFELWLFQPSVRKMVENVCEQDEARRAKEKSEHLENSIKKE